MNSFRPVNVVRFLLKSDGQIQHGHVGRGHEDRNSAQLPDHVWHHAAYLQSISYFSIKSPNPIANLAETDVTDLLLELRYFRRHEVLVKVPLDHLGVRRRTRVGALDRASRSPAAGILTLDRPTGGTEVCTSGQVYIFWRF